MFVSDLSTLKSIFVLVLEDVGRLGKLKLDSSPSSTLSRRRQRLAVLSSLSLSALLIFGIESLLSPLASDRDLLSPKRSMVLSSTLKFGNLDLLCFFFDFSFAVGFDKPSSLNTVFSSALWSSLSSPSLMSPSEPESMSWPAMSPSLSLSSASSSMKAFLSFASSSRSLSPSSCFLSSSSFHLSSS